MSSRPPIINRLRRVFHPRLAVIAHDLLMIWASWLVARALSTPGIRGLDLPLSALFLSEVPIILVVQGIVFWFTGLYRGLWRFASLPDLWNLIRGSLIGMVLVGLSLWLLKPDAALLKPQLLLIYPFALTGALGIPRLLYRSWKDLNLGRIGGRRPRRTLIIGAGHSGVMLVRELRRLPDYQVVGFLDDNQRMDGARIHGIPILGTVEQIPRVARETAAELAVIAMPSASNEQMQRVVGHCEDARIEFRTLPRLQETHAGARWDTIKPVVIEDLLGRSPVSLDWASIESGLGGATVLVSGGGGSIGGELCRQIARLHPASLVILERTEFNLFNIDRELRAQYPELSIHSVLGDAGDEATVKRLLQRHRPQIIFHAAAYKHLPLLQEQRREAVRNNVLATRNMALAADRHHVNTFVLISTDKAVQPTNVMGATKRAAELFCEGLSAHSSTTFITVRFGNVLNSSGSVVPLFQDQIARGGPVTVTHPEMERYFMTIPEASQLILQATVIGEDGDILVLDMGEPVKIVHLAEQLIRLAGKEPGKDIEIIYTGLRPGEKLSEELFHPSESLITTSHPKILRARHNKVDWQALQSAVADAERGVVEDNNEDLARALDSILDCAEVISTTQPADTPTH
ncbi:MAG: nucleoside-diphosphate sugar epimerase/dehydratase [Wenzhouxiangellaceae bacterium]